jgi:ribosomal protein L29
VKAYNSSPLDDHEESSGDEIEDILSELKTLSRELAKSKQQLRHKRLSSFEAHTIRNHR